jgi:hypothetical protein
MARFLLIQNYEGGAGCDTPMFTWAPEDIRAHIDFQHALNAELTASGELVDAQGLAGPDQAKSVTSDGVGAPVVTGGAHLAARELLAGYRVVDVESEDRAVAIAARVSAAPGAGGVAIRQPIAVRQVMGAPDTDL